MRLGGTSTRKLLFLQELLDGDALAPLEPLLKEVAVAVDLFDVHLWEQNSNHVRSRATIIAVLSRARYSQRAQCCRTDCLIRPEFADGLAIRPTARIIQVPARGSVESQCRLR